MTRSIHASGGSASQASNDDARIRAQIAERVRAVRAKDEGGLLALYAPDVVTFDVVAPLVNRGIEAIRTRVVEWLGSFETAIDYDVQDVHLVVSGDVALDHHLTHVKGTNKQGVKIDMLFRETIGYRLCDSKWLVVHQHSSVPFDR